MVEDDHAEARVTAHAAGRRTDRWRVLLPANPWVVAQLRLTVAVLTVTVVLRAFR